MHPSTTPSRKCDREGLSKSQNPCCWTLRSDMPWWSSFFLRSFLLVPCPLTYLSTLYVRTIVLLILVPTYVKLTCWQPTKTTRHCRGPKWGDVAKCRANIWRHVADMSPDTTYWPQNWQQWHPTCATKSMSMYICRRAWRSPPITSYDVVDAYPALNDVVDLYSTFNNVLDLWCQSMISEVPLGAKNPLGTF